MGEIIEPTSHPAGSLPALPHAQPAEGFPLGEPLLYLRAITHRPRNTITCTVENVYDQQIAIIQPLTDISAGRIASEIRFVVAGTNGAPILYLTRFGGRGQWQGKMMQISDAHGAEIGWMRPTSPVAQFYRTHGLTFSLEANHRSLGATDVPTGAALRQRTKPTPIVDHTGAEIARIQRQQLRRGDYGRYRKYWSDYLLDCPQPLPHPLPIMLLASAFTQYLYEQFDQGGWQLGLVDW
ncbi:hypothetical protein [Mycolicibacterium fortuitum]